MANPLSPLSASAANARLPLSREHSLEDLETPRKPYGHHPVSFSPSKANTGSLVSDVSTADIHPEDVIDWDEGASSPFETEVQSELQPTAAIHNPIKGVETVVVEDQDLLLSPFREDQKRSVHSTPFRIAEDDTRTPVAGIPELAVSPRSANTGSVLKRKAKGSASSSPMKTPIRSEAKRPLLDRSFAATPATTTKPAAQTPSTHQGEEGDISVMTFVEDATIDDTCFTAFSEVPNTDMTAFARLGQSSSPVKISGSSQHTPRPLSRHTPDTARTRLTMRSRSPSPTPRQSRTSRPGTADNNDTTNLLLDFTQQFEAVSSYGMNAPTNSARTPSRRSPSKPAQLLSYLQSQRSPAKHAPSTPGRRTLLNLLDIELPPAPTPRSIPTITIRELESLKSTYASEISSLKASLSGREAEVESLKKAVGDAERRVGESAESAREERNRRECAEKEKEGWERRGREFEEVLKSVKCEVLAAEKERTGREERLRDAEDKVKESEQRAEEAEARALAAATKLIPAAIPVHGEGNEDSSDTSGPMYTATQVQQQIDEKVHALSTELHAIYKKKHITKVAGLKKGFEAKSKEKLSSLMVEIQDLRKSNEELQAKIDGTISGVQMLPLASFTQEREKDRLTIEEQTTVIERQKAELAGRESELRTAKVEFNDILRELEQERVEKGELVAAVDEMLALQAENSILVTAGNSGIHHTTGSNNGIAGGSSSSSITSSSGVFEDFRRSFGAGARQSGLRGPGFGMPGSLAQQQQQQQIPSSGVMSRIAAPGRGGLGGAGKSKMMSNIERMGARRDE